MSNISVNETLLFSTTSESESATYWENDFSSTQHPRLNDLLLFIKNAFVCWFMKQILLRKQMFSYLFDLLLLVISFHSVCKRDLDICGLAFVWICYMQSIRLFWASVWKNCLILYIVTFILSANAPDYLSRLTFTVDILFVYTMLCEIANRRRVHSRDMLLILLLVFSLACYFDVLHDTPGPDMDELNLILMMLVPMIVFALSSEDRTFRAMHATLVFSYCEYLKNTLHGGTR